MTCLFEVFAFLRHRQQQTTFTLHVKLFEIIHIKMCKSSPQADNKQSVKQQSQEIISAS